MHIGDAFETGCIVIVLAAFIHFQFHTEVSFSVSVKDRCGLVAVFLDLVLKLIEASFAVGQVAVPADETFRNDLPAGFASIVEGIDAMSWSEFVSSIREPELIQYLKERRLYVNEMVTESEEM